MVTVDGYVGLPTTQRFTAYGSVFSANPTIGNLAVGGRLGFAWTTWINTGVSAAFAWDGGASTREDLALDLRFSPVSWMYLLGYVDWSLFASNYFDGIGAQIADSNVSLVFPVTPHLQFTGRVHLHGAVALPPLQLHPLGLHRQHPPVRRRHGAGRPRAVQGRRCPLDFEVGYRRIFGLLGWRRDRRRHRTPRRRPRTSSAPPGAPPRTPRWAWRAPPLPRPSQGLLAGAGLRLDEGLRLHRHARLPGLLVRPAGERRVARRSSARPRSATTWAAGSRWSAPCRAAPRPTTRAT